MSEDQRNRVIAALHKYEGTTHSPHLIDHEYAEGRAAAVLDALKDELIPELPEGLHVPSVTLRQPGLYKAFTADDDGGIVSEGIGPTITAAIRNALEGESNE